MPRRRKTVAPVLIEDRRVEAEERMPRIHDEAMAERADRDRRAAAYPALVAVARALSGLLFYATDEARQAGYVALAALPEAVRRELERT